MSAPLLTGRRRVRQQLAGVLFLAVLAGLVALTVLLYQKAFTDVVTVFVEADRVGNQLTKGADVKHRGVIVGEVRGVSSDGGRARLELALDPQEAERIPSDARVQMLPKTLFGEKFVAVVTDDASRAEPLDEGDVIAQDRSETARETSEALDDLLPLLQALKPQQLSTTLNALSGRAARPRRPHRREPGADRVLPPADQPRAADAGRGLPRPGRLREDPRDGDARPHGPARQLLRAGPQPRRHRGAALDVPDGVGQRQRQELEDFLGENEQRLVRLAADSLPSLEVYAKYSPGLPLPDAGPGQPGARRRPGLRRPAARPAHHAGVHERPGRLPARSGRAGLRRGPRTPCTGLPPSPVIPDFPATYEPVDGYCDEEERASPGIDSSDCRTPEDESNAPGEPADASRQPARALVAPRDLDRATVAAAAGPVMGVAPSDVPDLALLLFGPVARGTTVALQPQP